MNWLIVVLAGTLACNSDTDESTDTGATNTPPTGGETSTVEGCEGASFIAREADLRAAGPWPVGARTVEVDGLTVEIWYPAPTGTADGAAPKVYDVREALPESEREAISDELNPWQTCDCTEGLELDTDHGPYPLIGFVHGTAAFRTQSLGQMVHWASRGFVVVAADHPGLYMADILAYLCPDEPSGSTDIEGDLRSIFDAIEAGAGDLAFLSGHVDTERIALVGHSAGGAAVADLAATFDATAVIPLASGTPVDAGPAHDVTLFMGAKDDTVVPYESTVDGYEASPAPKALVGVDDAGHLLFSELCWLTNDAGDDLVTIAQNAGVCGTEFASVLFDCDPDYIDGETSMEIVNFATTAVLQDALQCTDERSALEDMPGLWDVVEDLEIAF